MENWLNNLSILRSINYSNVFLVETDDPKRLQELLVATTKDLLKKGNKVYQKIYEVNIQLREVVPLRGPQIDLQGPLTLTLSKQLRKEPTLLIMSWVVTKQHADQLLDFLLAVAHHPQVYLPSSEKMSSPPYLPSTVIVFTHSLALFPENARKFFAEISIPPSLHEERKTIIENLAKEYKELFGKEVRISNDAIAASAGLTLHEIETACLESLKLRQAIDADTFRKHKIGLLRRLGLEYIEPRYGFEAVGGYDYLKDFLARRIVKFFRRPEIVPKYGLRPPRGILLFGPPGTGKSWLARALAKEMGLPMVSLSSADLLRGIVGESEQRTRKIARIIESMAPIVVFIDEADQLFQSRGAVMSTDSGVFRRVQNILLEWLGNEERKAFIVMATNYLQQFDFASVRAGRIDYAIPVMLPDFEARKQILKLHTEVLSRPKIPVSVDYGKIAKMTLGFTGAELRQLAETSKIISADRNHNIITTEHFLEALKTVRIDIDQRKKLVTSMLKQAEKLETVIIPPELLRHAEKVFETEKTSQVSRLI